MCSGPTDAFRPWRTLYVSLLAMYAFLTRPAPSCFFMACNCIRKAPRNEMRIRVSHSAVSHPPVPHPPVSHSAIRMQTEQLLVSRAR